MNEQKKLIFGLIGYPVKHSFSAAMHNAAFAHLGINADYRLFEVKPEKLKEFLLQRKDLSGVNITIPHKVQAKQIVEENFQNSWLIADKYSDYVGAINTIGYRPDGSIGWTNTDAPGFVKALKQDLGFKKTENSDALVFGCGGAGRAVLSGLSRENLVKNIYVSEINEQSKKATCDHYVNFPQVLEKLQFITEDEIKTKIKDCALLVNTTPVGMKPESDLLIDKTLLHDNLVVYDVVYNRETRLVKDAKEKGLKASGGISMLLYQGVLAFHCWMRVESGKVEEVMRKALEGELAKCRI